MLQTAAQTASVVTKIFAGFLTDTDEDIPGESDTEIDDGNITAINSAVATLALDSGIALAPIPSKQIITQNMSIEIFEKSSVVKYPVIQIYSDRVRNLLTEKFRKFSGKVRTVAEVRVSQDRIEGLEDQLRLYVDAVAQVLDSNRGDWGQGAFYAGGYEVAFDPVKQGGKNFLQVAKVTFEVDMSV
jgi:hypothetical protein